MKKILLSFLSLTGLGFSASAQSHINIELLSATYTAPAVQFRVSWNSIPATVGETHHSKIWLWVDFIEIKNNQPSGSWTRATVSNPSPGTVASETNKGFWLQGNSGSYSQTVTVALPDITPNTKFNWCAYASDCPPNVTAANGTYTFKGTPPFTLIASDGTTTQTVTGTTLAASALTVTPTTIRDRTECPGVFCSYQGSDLYIDGTHFCQLRTGGAQNWEAYIEDSRDDNIYRITQFSDGSWWMAEDLQYAGKRIAVCGNHSFYRGHDKPDCPSNWAYPTLAQIQTRDIGFNDLYGASYIAANWKRVCSGDKCENYNRMDICLADTLNTLSIQTDGSMVWNGIGTSQAVPNNTNCNSGRVRCFRQL